MTNFNTIQDVFKDMVASQIASQRRPILLVGNGFSRECCKANQIDDVFSYSSILNQIEGIRLVNKDKTLGSVFKCLETEDFEYVLYALNQAKVNQSIIELLTADKKVSDDLTEIIKVLKKSIADAILKIHPKSQYEKIGLDSYSACSAFLKQFGHIYTVNYDLFLYWAQMNDQYLKDNLKDGFWSRLEDKLYWDSNIINDLYEPSKRICYLHGGLHIFMSSMGSRIPYKVSISPNGFIVDGINKQIEEGHRPLYVTEGASSRKLDKIYQNDYLTYCYNALSTCNEHSLVTYGVSFANDEHILNAIKHNNHIKVIYVGLYGDEAPMRKVLDSKTGKRVLSYDSSQVFPWGSGAQKNIEW